MSRSDRDSPYGHFVLQAEAFLHGEAAIALPDPKEPDAPSNGYFQDAMPVIDAAGNPTGRALIPFPPLPAILLLPFVALWGAEVNGQWLAVVIGAADVGLAWWLLGRLGIGNRARRLATLFFGFGSALWYAAATGTTWYLAHVVAVGATLLSIGLALGADSEGSDVGEASPGEVASTGPVDPRRIPGRPGRLLDGRQVAAGLMLGLAATARLTVAFGAPFLLLVGGGSVRRRVLSAGLGMAVPLLGLTAYNLVSTGQLFHPAYEYQYQREAFGYPWLGYHVEWSIQDLRYLPQNIAIMLARLPSILPPCADPGMARSLFNPACPIAEPDPVGMSLLLTSPAWLFALTPLVRVGRGRRARIVIGASLSALAIAVVNLMHFSQGWVQFGYRFANDFGPFALLLVALGFERASGSRRSWALALALVAVSIAVNLWGAWWGQVLNW